MELEELIKSERTIPVQPENFYTDMENAAVHPIVLTFAEQALKKPLYRDNQTNPGRKQDWDFPSV